MFIPDKSVDLVLAGEGRAVPFFMLMRAPSDVVCMAAIERAILPIGEQIDIEGHERFVWERRRAGKFWWKTD